MSITDDISLPRWPHNIVNNDANLRKISSKYFGIIELKYLTIAPLSQVNDRKGRIAIIYTFHVSSY